MQSLGNSLELSDRRWPHKFEVDPGHGGNVRVDVRDDVIDWCHDQFGDDQERWAFGMFVICFRNLDDAMMFKLRWF